MDRPLLVGIVLLACTGWAQADSPTPATQPNSPQSNDDKLLSHIVVDRKNKRVDIDAVVVLREGEWLELLACSPRTKEYESILSIAAPPSQIHLALLLLGLQPGAPMSWERNGAGWRMHAPTGPRIAVTLRYEKDGRTVEVPANEWVVNQKTRTNLDNNIWLFAGSHFNRYDNKEIYSADVNGSALSLVNFGDDLLVKPTNMTNQNDEQTWGARTPFIPPVGTQVVVRLTPLEKIAATQPASQPDR